MELQEAVSLAMEFARKTLPGSGLSVEEVDYDDAPPAWLITVGYKRPLPEKRRAQPLGGAAMATMVDRFSPEIKYIEYEDVYKTIVVPEEGGRLKMKIRKL